MPRRGPSARTSGSSTSDWIRSWRSTWRVSCPAPSVFRWASRRSSIIRPSPSWPVTWSPVPPCRQPVGRPLPRHRHPSLLPPLPPLPPFRPSRPERSATGTGRPRTAGSPRANLSRSSAWRAVSRVPTPSTSTGSCCAPAGTRSARFPPTVSTRRRCMTTIRCGPERSPPIRVGSCGTSPASTRRSSTSPRERPKASIRSSGCCWSRPGTPSRTPPSTRRACAAPTPRPSSASPTPTTPAYSKAAGWSSSTPTSAPAQP